MNVNISEKSGTNKMEAIQNKQLLNVAAVTHTDIVIVGYGPVGAALAVYLGKLGISAVVIEKNMDILQMPRAIALDNEALRVLQQIGLSEDSFEKIIINKVQMYCPFVGKFAEINTSGYIDELPKLVTFYQPDLERALREKLATYNNIQVLSGSEFLSFEEQSDSLHVLIKDPKDFKQIIQTRYLIGADGASSKIRSAIGMDFKGESYIEDWLIVDAKNRAGKAIDHVEFTCDPNRPTPHMPAPGGRERWEFMLQGNETREEMERPEKIQELLKPWIKGQDLEIERQAVYRFHARCCDHFQKGNVFLVGDAAHITPPFVGQGLVAGLRDIANLGWKLKAALNSKKAAVLLESYDMERRPHARKMIHLAKGMGMVVMPDNAFKAIVTHGLIQMLSKFPLTKPYLTDLKFKPQIKYNAGFFQQRKKGFKTHSYQFGAGKQIAQIRLKDRQNNILKSDDCWGTSFAIISMGANIQDHVSLDLIRQWHELGGKIFHVSAASNHTASTDFIDIDNQWALNPLKSFVVILRPDGIIYDVFEISKASPSIQTCINQLA